MASRAPVATTQRRLSPTQAATRERLLNAAIELAEEGGYEVVSVSAVAQRAGMSQATGYLYFGSRDEVLFQASDLLLGRGTARTSERHDGDLKARLKSEFRHISREVAARPQLYRALFAARTSAVESSSGDPWTSWLAEVLGSAGRPLSARATNLLTYLTVGALISIVSERHPTNPARAIASFDLAVDELLP